jgi:hypothetical protein
MKTKIAAVLGVALLAVALPAQAAKPQPISLTLTMHSTNATTATGSWTSTSDLPALHAKSGTAAQMTRVTGQGKGNGKKTGQNVHGRTQLTATDGTIVLQFVGAIKQNGTTTSEVNGRFVLKKGTGAYSGLHGTGGIHATLDSASGSITAVYTGKAHVNGG